jgi:enoyl-CoA hydratase/carnithine racemase
MSDDVTPPEGRITTEVRDHVLLMGVDRPDKRNAFGPELLVALCEAYTRLDEDPELRCGVVFAHGEHFTAGLDLLATAPTFASGEELLPPELVNPWGTIGRRCRKPVVVAVHGRCLTLGIELLLNAECSVAAEDARFAQIEVQRGIFPFGGATVRFPQRCGWGNAMRWILSGDELPAEEALRIGLVHEVVPTGQQLERAIEIASSIAKQAPLAVQATLANARKALDEGEQAAIEDLLPTLRKLLVTEDAAEGVQSFVERREAVFQGK